MTLIEQKTISHEDGRMRLNERKGERKQVFHISNVNQMSFKITGYEKEKNQEIKLDEWNEIKAQEADDNRFEWD